MSEKKNSFLVQGSILAAAGILTRVIGIIYRVPLTNILGESGVSAYSIAYDIYSLFLLISSLSLPLAVSKIVAARLAKKEYKNVKRTFMGSILIAVVIGLVVSLLVFVFADNLAAIWKFSSAAIALKVLAPTLFVMCVLGVLRGFFQGMGTMIPTALSQIFEQIVNAIVSIVAAYMLYRTGESVGKSVEYGAAGGTLGTASGALAALLFMLFVYIIFKPGFDKKVRRDNNAYVESYSELYKALAVTIFPVLLSTTIYNISSILDSAIYGNITSGVFGFTEEQYSPFWGIYSSQYRLLTTAPIAIASALSSAVVPSLIKSITNRDYSTMKNKMESSIRLTMIVAIPCGVGLTVMGGPIVSILFKQGSLYKEIVMMMRFSVLVVCGYSFSTITNSILQGIDKMKLPVVHSAISLGFHMIILPVLLLLKMDIYAVVIADIIFSFMICFLNTRAIRKYTGYRQELVKTFVLPTIASVIMGIITLVIYTLLNKIMGSILIPTVIAILAAVIIYAVLLVAFKAVDENELKSFPGGTRLIGVFERVGLL